MPGDSRHTGHPTTTSRPQGLGELILARVWDRRQARDPPHWAQSLCGRQVPSKSRHLGEPCDPPAGAFHSPQLTSRTCAILKVCSRSLGPAPLQAQAGVGFSAPTQSAHQALSSLGRGQGKDGLELGPWAKKDDAPSCWKGSPN